MDFWRVSHLEPGRELVLHAEMKLPGEAWLSWRADPTDNGSKLTQTATFVPRGLLGRAYWYSLVPFHAVIFGAMAQRIAAAAAKRQT